jgi:glycosyltransferase involved in cell wall biosynthesis
MKVSIIIPALNEEKNLARLLDSIKAQDFDGYEVIVADANSTDRTREVAATHGCRIVDGGKPAAGRNAGAAVANGEYLFFLDADVIVPPGFISNVYNEMQDRFIDLATCELKPLSDYQMDRVIHRLMNLAILLNLWLDPKAFGCSIFVTKRLFNRVGGFDETIFVAEDNDFVKRASVFRSLRYLSSANVMVSVRRFEKEGRFMYMKKGIKLNLYRTFWGEIRNDKVVNYDFDMFDSIDYVEDRNFLDKIERRLLKIEENARSFNDRAKLRKGNVNPREIKHDSNEYAHLVKELDAYLSKSERQKKKTQKIMSFFKPKDK